MKNRILLAFLILLWMITVFCFSNENGQESSNTSGKIVEIIVETINNERIEEDKIEVIVRKGAHLTLYMVGGVLIFAFFNTYKIVLKKKVISTIVLGLLYAITDEIHQGFIPGRTPQIIDILIDTVGISLRNITCFFCNKVKKEDKKRQKNRNFDKILKKYVNYGII